MTSRRSVRAYLPSPVPRHEIEQLLTVASRTASNSNSQPWAVHVLTGRAKDRFSEALWAALDANFRTEPEYPYQPEPEAWHEPLRGRRKAFGDALYRQTLGIAADDLAGRQAHHRRNYEFFGAPVGMILTVDRRARCGGLVDAGAFLQALMLLARERGLDTCPQASFNNFHPVVREHLRLPDDQLVVCGLALGYADPDHRLNRLCTERLPLERLSIFWEY
jgi:nitroreductase